MDEEMKLNDDTGFRNRNAISTDVQKSLENQREPMALNSECLEGLVPRAKPLLTTGGTFFLAFGPLILITVAFFSALYFYFGPSLYMMRARCLYHLLNMWILMNSWKMKGSLR